MNGFSDLGYGGDVGSDGFVGVDDGFDGVDGGFDGFNGSEGDDGAGLSGSEISEGRGVRFEME